MRPEKRNAAAPGRAAASRANAYSNGRHDSTRRGVEELLGRLEKVRKTEPDRWMACCPAHDDRTPSLSIRQAEDRLLIYCFAGCHVEDIIAAVGLSFADLYTDPARASYMSAVAHGGREIERNIKFDPLAHERIILRIAKSEIEAGRQLSVEDRARTELAIERLRGAK